MPETLNGARDVLDRLDARGVIDILVIAVIFFSLFLMVRGTTAMSVLRGIAILMVCAWAISSVLELQVLGFLVRNSLTAFLVATPIVFQQEIRRALERVGRLGIRALFVRQDYDLTVDSVVAAALELSREHHGGLIVLERETGLEEYIESGVRLDASPTPELIAGIFFPNSPLHDGALVIRENRLVAAGCTLPLAEKPVRGAGTRHRAAVGITERTDAVSVVVSEETGDVSVAFDGRLRQRLDEERLRSTLYAAMRGEAKPSLDGQRRGADRRVG